MKPISEYRNTDQFCIGGSDVQNMARIYNHYGTKVIAVAHHKKEHGRLSDYTVRFFDEIDGRTALVDAQVRVSHMRVEEAERVIIRHDPAEEPALVHDKHHDFPKPAQQAADKHPLRTHELNESFSGFLIIDEDGDTFAAFENKAQAQSEASGIDGEFGELKIVEAVLAWQVVDAGFGPREVLKAAA